MTKITQKDKNKLCGGVSGASAAWMAMVGVSVLASTMFNVVSGIVGLCNPDTQSTIYGSDTGKTYVRLSPFAARSSFSLLL